MYNRKTVILTILCLTHFTQFLLAQPSAQSATQSLDPRFAQYDKKLSDNPRVVINELLAISINEQQNILAAQYHFTLSRAYLNLVYPQESLAAANQALTLLPEKLPAWLYHRILITKSQAMDLNGQANEAQPLAQQALNWSENLGDETMVIDALIAIGYIENTLGNSVVALDAFMRAYNMAPVADAIVTKGAIASSLALVYEYRREDKLAIPYFEEAVVYHRSTKNLLELSIALYGLGRANKNIGKLELGQAQLQESLDISRAIDDDQGVAYALKELAPLYMQSEQFEQAESMLKEATNLFNQSQNQFMLFDLHKTLAQLYMKKNDSYLAQVNIQLAKQHLNEVRMPIQAIALAELESQLSAAQGLYQQAFTQLLSTVSKKQKLLSERSSQQLHELRTQFELEAQADENSKLTQENIEQKILLLKEEQQNQILVVGMITAASLVLLLIAAALYNRKKQRQLYQLANYDQLTGLPNRTFIWKLLETNYHDLKPEQHIHIAMLDLDHFKQINDQQGHDVGDQVLQAMGRICQNHILPPHSVGRFGGEEFLLAFIDIDYSQVKSSIETIRASAKNINHKIDANCPNIEFSVGVSTCRSSDSLKETIKAADTAMYEAKNTGRNKIVTDF